MNPTELVAEMKTLRSARADLKRTKAIRMAAVAETTKQIDRITGEIDCAWAAMDQLTKPEGEE